LCGANSSPPKYGYSLYPVAFMVVLVPGNESTLPFKEKI